MSNQLLFGIVLVVFLHHGLGTTNFALHKPAFQSSTLYWGFPWTADKAVDGNTDGWDPNGSRTCSSTQQQPEGTAENNTWEVNIGFPIIMKTITVYGRTSRGSGSGLIGTKLYLRNSSGPSIYALDLVNNPHVYTPTHVIASVVSLMKTGQIMVICEVTIDGECLDGMFSESCNETCGKCIADKLCNKTDGTCPNGCIQGWKGPLCKEACERGKYGYDCNDTCGKCLYGNDSCSISDGNCTNGCQAGWQGVQCNKATTNFALHKPAVQSSTLNWFFDWTADKAVDGNTDGSNPDSSKTCSSTVQSSPKSVNNTWEVNIGFPIIMKTITVYGRTDRGTGSGLTGTKLYLRNASGPSIYALDLVNNPHVYTPTHAIASVLSLMKTGPIMVICEVTVDGECLDGMFSESCNETCGKCIADKLCNKTDGTCPNGCSQGWKGPLCKEACERGKYGYDCNDTCGKCLYGNNSCSISDGNCTNGCQAGWQGVQCNKECDRGKYGYNCNETCGKCFNGNDSCSLLDGNCTNGCQAGWKGLQCDTECAAGTYGVNCNETCGACLNGPNKCSKTDGLCIDSCQAGWVGVKCIKECDRGSYGFNCSQNCGNCKNGKNYCSPVNGTCAGGCQAGWNDTTCKTECVSGTYGFSCVENCGYCLNGPTNCSKTDGMCTGGCVAGWMGEQCKQALKNSQNEMETIIIGGSVGGAVAVVVLIVVIVVIIFHRRRKQKRPSLEMTRATNAAIIYENPLSMDWNSDTDLGRGKERVSEGNEKRGVMPKEDKMAPALQSENHDIYYNVSKGLPKGTIALSKFWDYVQEKCLDDKYFSEEFETLPSGSQLPTSIALSPENKKKNRYKDLYAYDTNRVVLKPLGNDVNDYMNASFVDGYSTQRMYIASQGTTKENINDFWRMMWQYDVEKIVMLTGLFEGGKHKCELYWPEEEGQTSTFGNVSVTFFDTDLFADYEIRSLEMSVRNKSKRLTQFHYTAWPDKGVPRATSSLVLFWNRVNRVPTNKPIVVHCSAGIGRTGTYIALDILVNQGRAEGNVNVWACVSNLRHQRVNMVQTMEQYIFLHETLVEALMLSGTATTSDRFPNVYQELLEVDGKSGKRKLQIEYERLQHEDVNHETVYAFISIDNEGDEEHEKQDEFTDAKKPENRAKNRYDNILPADRHRVFLNTSVPGRNDYINAVLVPSHRRRHGFVLTQMPLTGTIVDFWRMIHDLEVKTVVMLNSETSKNSHDIGDYWPKKGDTQYGPFSVRLEKEEEGRNYIQRTLSYSLAGVESGRFVTQFQVTNWPDNTDSPKSTVEFLEILDVIESWRNEEKPIIVHCLNGAERSGLYCVISTVIERLKLEKDVAITQTIKRIKAFRHQIIPNYEQFRFCHDCIIEYMKTFETYKN